MKLRIFSIFSLLLSLSTPAFALEQVGTISNSLGGAGRAAADPTEAIFLNPAAIGFLQSRLFSSAHYSRAENDDRNTNQYGFVFADGSLDKIVPGSLAYTETDFSFDDDSRGKSREFRAAIGGTPHPQLSFGLGGHYSIYNSRENRRFYQSNLNLGFLFVPFDWLGLALTGENLLKVNSDVDAWARDVRSYGFGFHFLYEELFRLRFDVVRPVTLNPQSRTNFHAGIENIFAQWFAMRLGFRWDEVRSQHFATGGLGYRGPRLSADYAFSQGVHGRKDETRHLIDLWITF